MARRSRRMATLRILRVAKGCSGAAVGVHPTQGCAAARSANQSNKLAYRGPGWRLEAHGDPGRGRADVCRAARRRQRLRLPTFLGVKARIARAALSLAINLLPAMICSVPSKVGLLGTVGARLATLPLQVSP